MDAIRIEVEHQQIQIAIKRHEHNESCKRIMHEMLLEEDAEHLLKPKFPADCDLLKHTDKWA